MAMLFPLLMLAFGTAAKGFMKTGTQGQSGYPPVPSVVSPTVWPAGAAASRQAKGASGAPQGQLWGSASRFATLMPGLIGR